MNFRESMLTINPLRKLLYIPSYRKLCSPVVPLLTTKDHVFGTRRLFATENKTHLFQRHKFEGAKVFDGPHGRFLSIEKEGCRPESQALDLVFLRDSCSCSRCVNPSSGQKEFETAAIPLDIDIAEIVRHENKFITIRWSKDIPGYDNHFTTLRTDLWHQSSTKSKQCLPTYEDQKVQPWTKSSLSSKRSSLNFDFSAYMNTDEVLHRLLKCIREFGIAFINRMPSDPSAVKSVGNRIGPIMNTFYGETWEVRTRPSAKNVAYTSAHLGFHMDLLYMRDPPYLQFLHCIKQSTEGGESLFSDTLNAVYSIQRHRPDLAPCMWNFPITYRYLNEGKFYQFNRPMVEGPGMNGADDAFQKWLQNPNFPEQDDMSSPQTALIWGQHIDAVNWSPPFQGPFNCDIGENPTPNSTNPSLRDYVKTASTFRSIIEAPENVYEKKMSEGTCVVFDNRRIVHARKAFANNSGERLLRGVYVDGNSFWSRLRAFDAGMRDPKPTMLNE